MSKRIKDITATQAEILRFSSDRVFEELVIVAKGNRDKSDTSLKYSDKNKAFELLGRHLGMCADKLEVTQERTPQVVLCWPENGRD